ncbi:hypothetical protein [Acidithrix sp. C25]|uniref:hypothetical protein n=1 Tax=Acidithrix sp. C25 TaxID=1671482 RepID=UPI00191B9C26|nr:hypothetical protein [Acidithrix sp. C25]
MLTRITLLLPIAMAGSISRLATGVAVILTPSRSHKGTAAPRAYDHTHIVTLL